jgi:hypothetical protein
MTGGMTIHTNSLRRSISVFLGLAVVLSHASKTVIAQRHDVCATDVQCLNEGKCQLVDHAETDIDVDGNIDDINGSNVHRHCVCPQEFGGSRCEKFCPLNCLNGGYCRFHNQNGGDSGSGSSTANYHERFDANPIDYNCECFGPFTGTFCEIPYENCSDGRQCFHGGTCAAAKNNKKTACACPEGFEGGSCAIDLSVSRVGARGSSSESNRSRAGPIVAGFFIPIIVAALVYAAFVYRRKRKYSALVGQTLEYDASELAPRGSARPSSGRQHEWKNII